MAGAILRKHARGQNPDKDEVAAVCNCRAASGGLATRTVVAQDGLTLRPSGQPSPPVGASSFSPAVPFACHKEQARAVSEGARPVL